MYVCSRAHAAQRVGLSSSVLNVMSSSSQANEVCISCINKYSPPHHATLSIVPILRCATCRMHTIGFYQISITQIKCKLSHQQCLLHNVVTLNVRFECCRRHLGGLALHIHAHMSTRMGLMWMLMLRPERVVRAFAEEPHFTGRCTIDLAGFTKETTCDYRHCPA